MEFSYERSFLERQLAECAQTMHAMATAGKLTEKSHRRIDLVFGALGEAPFLDRVFALGPRAVALLQNNNLSPSSSQSQSSGSGAPGLGMSSASSSGYSTPGIASASSSPSKHAASSASTDFHGFDTDWRAALSRQLAITVSAVDSLLEDGNVL